MKPVHFLKSSTKPLELERHQIKSILFTESLLKLLGNWIFLEKEQFFSLHWFYSSTKTAVVEWVYYFLGQLLWNIKYLILWACKISKSSWENGRFSDLLRIKPHLGFLAPFVKICQTCPSHLWVSSPFTFSLSKNKIKLKSGTINLLCRASRRSGRRR